MTPEELLHTGRKLLERSGVAYGDMRHVRIRRERLRMRNGILDPAFRDLDAGFGIRVLHRGAWGFAASNRMTGADLEQTVAAAVAVAEASARTRRNPVRLAPAEPARGRYRTPFRIDGFEVPLEDKVRLLREPVEAMQGIDGVLTAEAGLSLTREQKRFVSTEGADLEQDILHTGAGIAATARVGDEVQKRSFPNSFGGNVAAGGYEIATGAGLLENAVRVAEEARALCRAPDCPSRNTTLVVGADQMALQVHESCGHPTELDRVLGTEISLAGGSFMDLKGLGSLRYGSSLVNLTADATTPGGLGTFGWDDEGVPARRTRSSRRESMSGS